MRALSVTIFAGETVIGTADLLPSDPSMAVASGAFSPNEAYDVTRHSRMSEDRELTEPPLSLSVYLGDGTALRCAGVDLTDFFDTVGVEGRELSVLGMQSFHEHFGQVR